MVLTVMKIALIVHILMSQKGGLFVLHENIYFIALSDSLGVQLTGSDRSQFF